MIPSINSFDYEQPAGDTQLPCLSCKHYRTCWGDDTPLTNERRFSIKLRCLVRQFFIWVAMLMGLFLVCVAVALLTSCSTTRREAFKVDRVQHVEGHGTADFSQTVCLDSVLTLDLSRIRECEWSRTVTYFDTLGHVVAVSKEVVNRREEERDVTQQQVTQLDSATFQADLSYEVADTMHVEQTRESGDAARTGWQSFLHTLRTSWRIMLLAFMSGIGMVILHNRGGYGTRE